MSAWDEGVTQGGVDAVVPVIGCDRWLSGYMAVDAATLGAWDNGGNN